MTTLACSICGSPIDSVADGAEGHNAEPVNGGRCCARCNILIVLHRRMEEAKTWGTRRSREQNHIKEVTD